MTSRIPLRKKVANVFKSKEKTQIEPEPAEADAAQPPMQRPFSLPPCHLLPSFDQQTCLQSSSRIFALPPEIRRIIWQFAIGGRVIPLTVPGLSLLGRRIGPITRFPSLERDKRNWPGYKDVDLDTAIWTPVPLLLSCRRIHSEIVDLIYSSNTFYVTDIAPSARGTGLLHYVSGDPILPALSSLASTLHPHHLHSIRHLVVNLDYQNAPYGDLPGSNSHESGPPDDYKHWVVTWGILACLCGNELADTENVPRPSATRRTEFHLGDPPTFFTGITNGLGDYHMSNWRNFAGGAEVQCSWPGQPAGSAIALTDLVVTIGERYWHVQKEAEHLYSASWGWPYEEWDALSRPLRAVRGVPSLRLILSWEKEEDHLPEDLEGITIERTTDNNCAIQVVH